MKDDAVNDFLFLTDISLDYGLIDSATYIERMVSLYEMMDVEEGVIRHFIPPYGQRFYDYIVENGHGDDKNENNYNGEFGSSIRRSESDSTTIQLYQTSNSGKKCKWEFYDKDADPHPSVPHGHGIEETKFRLDPYRRIIYEKQNGLNQIDLEQKKFMKALWNNDDFRDYALKAIKNFISSGVVGQNYNWYNIRGIKNPLRLPRRRR